MSPYYDEAGVTLYLGDCREIMPTLDLELSLVLTDPPYGDTSLAWDRWPDGWVAALPMSPQLWCFGSMRMFLNHSDELARYGRYGQEIVWEKHNGSGFAADRFKRVHEFAMQWYRGQWGELTINAQYTSGHSRKTVARSKQPTHTGALGSPERGYDTTDRLMRSVVYVTSMNGKAIHPTEKPLGILEPIIKYSTDPGGLILDPFGGSCSTARAARALGRHAICIEADERYLEAAAIALGQGVLDFGAAS